MKQLNETIYDETCKCMEHVAGELRQRITDLEAKAKRPFGGALTGRAKGAAYCAKTFSEAAAVIEKAISKLPKPKGEKKPPPKSEEPKPPKHRNHPDNASR